ncbi:MAG: glycosyltransferase family 9 protein [Armatimonadota bacterium]
MTSAPVLPGIRTILAFAMNLLGDSICRLPAIKAAKDVYPGSRVIVVADPRYSEVFEGQPFIDEVWTTDRRGGKLKQFRAWLRLTGQARRAQPDLVLDLYGSKRTALLSRVSGARWRVGLQAGGRSRWYNLRQVTQAAGRGLPEARARGVDQPRAQQHIIERANAAVEPAGIGAEFRYVPLAVTEADRQTARRALAEVGLDAREGLVLLNPSARVEAKRWPAERFAMVAARLGRRCGVITAPGEEGLTAELVAAAEGAAAPLPVLSIKQLAALAQMARVIVTGDTGVLHVATAMGTPSAMIAGPTDPRLVAHPGARQVVLFHRDACAEWRGGEECADYNGCAKRRCIDAIRVEEVVAALSGLLSER